MRALKYRFAVARDHALGNLLLAALEDATGSFPEAIAICEKLVDAQGHVYPSTLDHVVLSAQTQDGRILDGQAVACHSKTALAQVWLSAEDGRPPRPYEPALQAIRDGRILDGQAVACHSKTALAQVWLSAEDGRPPRPYEPALQAIREADLIVLGPGSLFTSIIPNGRPPRPYEPALQAIREADLIVLGPGSLFTSIIPNLLIPGVVEAIRASRGRVLFVCALADVQGETWGLTVLIPGVVEAIRASRGRVLFVCALADVQGETWGLTAREHFEALAAHGMEGLIDYMLVHSKVPLRAESPATGSFAAISGAELEHASTSDLNDDQLIKGVRPISISYARPTAWRGSSTTCSCTRRCPCARKVPPRAASRPSPGPSWSTPPRVI